MEGKLRRGEYRSKVSGNIFPVQNFQLTSSPKIIEVVFRDINPAMPAK